MDTSGLNHLEHESNVSQSNDSNFIDGHTQALNCAEMPLRESGVARNESGRKSRFSDEPPQAYLSVAAPPPEVTHEHVDDKSSIELAAMTTSNRTTNDKVSLAQAPLLSSTSPRPKSRFSDEPPPPPLPKSATNNVAAADKISVGKKSDIEDKGKSGGGGVLSVHPPVDQVPPDSELGKLWKAVRNNREDFTSWTYLLDHVEREDNILYARPAFENFLQNYPYCYGYWKKYADIEKRHLQYERCIQVYENGVKVIALSVDLWTAYLDCALEIYQNEDDFEDTIRCLYERAIAAAGLEFRSDKLWEHYITWESNNGNLVGITTIYDRFLATPTQMYYQNWENFKRHIQDHETRQVITPEEFLELYREFKNATGNSLDVDMADAMDDMDCTTPIASVDISISEDDIKNCVTAKDKIYALQLSFDELNGIKERLLARRELTFQETYEQITRRWYFEEKIRRPYFHVKPLERGQLNNWKEYLDFEISEGNVMRVIVLFERCLVACARYEEFWIKYAKYLECNGMMDEARLVWERACVVHLPSKATVHWSWSTFEERMNQPAKALAIMTNLEKLLNSQPLVTLRRISCLRRMGELDTARKSFQDALERVAGQSELRTFLAEKFARFLFKDMNDYPAAVAVLKDAVEVDRTNQRLSLQLLDMAYQASPVDEALFLDTIDQVLQNELIATDVKLSFSRRKMEFLEDFSSDIHKISLAFDEYQFLLSRTSDSRKRSYESCGRTDQSESVSKKLRDSLTSYSGGSYDPITYSGYEMAMSTNGASAAASLPDAAAVNTSYLQTQNAATPSATWDPNYYQQYAQYYAQYGYQQ